MAKKKYYAVKKGMKPGIYETWAECQALVSNFPGAQYKSFPTKEEATDYLNGKAIAPSKKTSSHAKTSSGAKPSSSVKSSQALDDFTMLPTQVIAYVDGSYEDSIKKYSFGCVILTPDGTVFKEAGNGNNPASLAIRNVAGEMLGAMFAVRWAMVNGYKEIELRYDYEGIEKWVTGAWKAKNELSQKYAAAMNSWKASISISFTKVLAHSNNLYNDEADRLAKEALTNANGIPPIVPRQ